MDTAETQVQFPGDAPTVKPGDIPDIPMPPEKIVDSVLDGLEKTPPQAFEPRLQYKKQFRELCQEPGGLQNLFLSACLVDFNPEPVYNIFHVIMRCREQSSIFEGTTARFVAFCNY